MTSSLEEAVALRRTFAIISHPDAGKTTLTEKLLLYGGAIQTAGQVAARRRARAVTSDWMELERERGISITSTVLQFPYHAYTINLLDTPGHQDFGEDTYRTLLAADSAVMLIDAAKGVEPQTKKLFAICRARGIPLFTFINKMDRPSREPLELLDELEHVLGIGAYPVNWPLGSGERFRGLYDRGTREMHLFERVTHGSKRAPVRVTDAHDARLSSLTDPQTYEQFLGEIELLDGAGADFDRDAMLRGQTSPVFFGSAVTNFGVELFLEAFCRLAPSPRPRTAASGEGRAVVAPSSERFSGFVFKIQANMDPRHRDRVAFVRVCSGKFERDMTVRNVRTGKDVRLTRAMKLFASEREVVNEAFAGDVVGLANPGTFAIGDTLCSGEPLRFDDIPAFAPEHFAGVRSIDTSTYKSFQKGIAQLSEEGAIQVFYPSGAGSVRSEPILGAVGELQFEVVKYRLESEYGVKTHMTRLPFSIARCVKGDAAAIAAASLPAGAKLVEDGSGEPVALFEAEWSIRLAEEWSPGVRFTEFGPNGPKSEVI
jgi:peptide chain release factor 3